MPKFYNISKWRREIHTHTTGTRRKFIAVSENGKKHYFKTSLKRDRKDYKYEFWSEVIASELGLMLGFDVVKYNVAYTQNEIGCLSESIIQDENEELHDGFRYLVEFFPELKDEKVLRKSHSFQKIRTTIDGLKMDHALEKVIDMIIFDAIIGNSDRHSENWAFLIKNKGIKHAFQSYLKSSSGVKLLDWILLVVKRGIIFNFKKEYEAFRRDFCNLSPLYDSGSSLGRELNEVRISELINDRDLFEKYLSNGKPDIRWEDKNLNHFELVDVIKVEHPEIVNKILKRIKDRYSKTAFEQNLRLIDRRVPTQFNSYKVPDQRKRFITMYIDERINYLLRDI